jgi:hypothetical protein
MRPDGAPSAVASGTSRLIVVRLLQVPFLRTVAQPK